MITSNAVILTDHPIDLSDVGIDTVPPSRAEEYLKQSNPIVLGLNCTPGNYQGLVQVALKERRKNPRKQYILVHEDLSSSQLAETINLLRPTKVLHIENSDNLRTQFQMGFRQYYEVEQSENMAQLVNEKNEELKRLTIQLEQKVEMRQNQLEVSIAQNTEAEKRLTTLKKTLLQIYKASSIGEIELGIADALKKEMDISWVNIRLPSQTNFPRPTKDLIQYRVSLKSGKKDFGFLLFFRSGTERFSKEEKKFLSQVAEAASLSIERTFQYQKSQELKRQWEVTFDSISDPICLTDEDYNIVRVNRSTSDNLSTMEGQNIIGQKCYKALFAREEVCPGCNRGSQFRLQLDKEGKSSDIYDVFSNVLEDGQSPVYFQMYRDITRDLNLQLQVIESAKMAELGTISSSIAHELNNPIGGMLNFIQLMKMDLTGEESFYEDIIEIEKGGIKCKTIVQNLLGFSRKSDEAKPKQVNLLEVIEQAVMITELKTRALGIAVQLDYEKKPMLVDGRFNLLAHAVRNVLQNAQESIIEKRSRQKNYQGFIQVSVEETPGKYLVHFTDDGVGIPQDSLKKIFNPLFTTKDPEKNSGLGLTLAQQIVSEHDASLEVTTNKDNNIRFTFAFSKSEGESE